MVELGTLRFMPPGPGEAEGVGEEAPLGGRHGGQWPLEGKEAKDLTKQIAHPTHMQIRVHQNTCVHLSIQHHSEEPQTGNSTVGPSAGEWVCQLWRIHTMESYTTRTMSHKRNDPKNPDSDKNVLCGPVYFSGLNWE